MTTDLAEPGSGVAAELDEVVLDDEGSVVGLVRANVAGDTATRAKMRQRVFGIDESPAFKGSSRQLKAVQAKGAKLVPGRLNFCFSEATAQKMLRTLSFAKSV
jgi:hypothetical protein